MAYLKSFHVHIMYCMSVLSACTCVIYTLGLLLGIPTTTNYNMLNFIPPAGTPPSSKPAIAAKPAEKACRGFFRDIAAFHWVNPPDPQTSWSWLPFRERENISHLSREVFRETHSLPSVPANCRGYDAGSLGGYLFIIKSLHLGIAMTEVRL